MEGINSWARVNKAKEISLDEVMALKDRNDISEEEKHIGISLDPDCRKTVVADGIVNYIGDLKSEDGVPRVRIMCSMNMPHWPTPEMSHRSSGSSLTLAVTPLQKRAFMRNRQVRYTVIELRLSHGHRENFG